MATGIGHAQAFVKTATGLPAPNIQLAFAAFSFDLDDAGQARAPQIPSVSTLVALMRTSHRGRITLRSADPLAPPVIEHRLLGSDDDVDQIVEGFEVARAIMAQPAIARFVTAEVRPGATLDTREALAGYVRLASIPLYHPVGTCKIGTDDMAVVDADLRVRGLDRPVGRRCLGDAVASGRQHQCHRDHDRRQGRGSRAQEHQQPGVSGGVRW